jgi:hypothetical protein
MIIVFVIVYPITAEDSVSKRQTLDAVILVADRFEAADGLEEWADKNGGYLISRVRDRIILRLPSSSLGDFIDFIEALAEEIIKIQQHSKDISQNILEAEAGIRSKEELFKQAVILLDQSDFSTTFEIESEVLSILVDIEHLKGIHRKLLGEGTLARVQIDFRLEEEKIPESLPSSFPWINTVDFYRLMEEFDQY